MTIVMGGGASLRARRWVQLRRLAAINVVTAGAVLGCSGAPEEDFGWRGEIEQEVLNGDTTWTTEAGRYVMQPTVRVRTSGGLICTGTALRNNMVLTARHCATTDGDIDSPLAAANTISVATSPNAPTAGCNTTTCRTVSVIETTSTTQDVALLVLSSTIQVNGSSQGHAVKIDPFNPSVHEGRDLFVGGYGRNTEAGGSGTLRSGSMSVIDTNGAWESGWVNTGRVLESEGVTALSGGGQSMWSGDSGGPYWNQPTPDPATSTVTQVPMVLAVHSRRSGSGDSTVAHGTISSAFRNWVNNEIFERTGLLSTPLTNPGHMSSLEVRTPVGGSSGPPTWAITGHAALHEPTNFNTPAPDRVGSFILHRSAVFENFDMSVSVRGTDNDSVGLVFWYIDDENYLRFSIDEQNSEARIIRMTPNGGVTLASNTSFAPNFNNDTVLRVRTSGRDITAYVNGAQVLTAQDRNIMIGRVGIYENAMADVHFFGWTVTPLSPTTSSVAF